MASTRRGWSGVQATALLAVLLLSLPVSMLRAQEIAYAASIAELDSVTQAALWKEVAQARERGLPIEPLVAKVREGRLKRATGPRIRAAVERLGERLHAARDALGAGASAEELIAGADALAAGAQPSSLRAVRAATTQSVTAPIGALAQLLASGVTESKAVEMVIRLMKRNASPALLVALGNQVETDVATGLSPAASAAFRLRALEGELTGTAAAPAGAFVNMNSAGKPNSGSSTAPQRKP